MALTSSRNRQNIVWQILFVIILCVGLVAVILIFDVFETPSTRHQVTFQVKGSAGFAQITYTNTSLDKVDPGQVTIPWQFSGRFNQGEEVYLTAANPSQLGDIECQILLDNEPWKKDTARAPETNVACGGIIP